MLGIALVLAVRQLWQQHGKALQSHSEPEPEDVIEFFVRNADTRQFSADGHVKYHLTSSYLSHLKRQQTTYLEQPRLTLYGSHPDSPWKVSSDTAIVQNKGESIILQGSVVIEQAARALKLQTETLTLWPERSYAETDKTVTIHAPSGSTRATGMQIDLHAETLKLLNKVQSRYDAKP